MQPGDAVVLREIRLPLKEPFEISSGTQHERRMLLVEVRTRDGLTAWSECVAQEQPNYSPETIDTAWFAITEWFVPILHGNDDSHPGHVLNTLDRYVRGHHMAKAALEMAAWNLLAQRRGEPLASLLGGTREYVPAGVSIGIKSDPGTLVDQVRRRVEEGYRKIKIKIKPGADVSYVAAVRETLGDGVPLAVDANSAYGLDDMDRIRSLDQFGLIMLEQPLAHDDLSHHAVLQGQIETPICLDESITGLARAEDMVRLKSGRIINVKPGRVGGIGPAKAIHDLCRRSGIRAWVGGMLESGIGRAYNVALAALPHFTIPGDISPSGRYWDRDIVHPEWTMSSDGLVRVPLVKPGLGIDVDVDRVEDLTFRRRILKI